MSAMKDRRARSGLKLPMIPAREEQFGKPVPLPLPVPSCPPPPLPLPQMQPVSRSGANAVNLGGGSTLPVGKMERDVVEPDDTLKISVLGHGSSGKVHKVRHRQTGKIYALKIIQEKHELSIRRQIMREMAILRRANSPYVVRCHGVSDKGGEISFVLEYMDGGSLADVLEKNKKVSECYLAEVARQVLRGLMYLHQNKIVHRDIKPSNLLLNHRQEVKIADFGVSTVLASTLAPCNSFVGTCAYMSPERFDPESHGGKYDGYAADIWSLGLSLLECAIGHFPLLSPGQKADWPTLMVAICYGEPPSPPINASPEFKSFIKDCLQKDPSRRPTASQLLSYPFITKYERQPCSLSSLLQSLAL
eukprot:c26442_g1_i1 orf=1031-2116(-)